MYDLGQHAASLPANAAAEVHRLYMSMAMLASSEQRQMAARLSLTYAHVPVLM
jgi:hypothetical protein